MHATYEITAVTLWVILCSSLVCCQTKCSSNGKYAVISEELMQLVIPDRFIVQPYQADVRIPAVCNIDKTCSSLLLEVENKQSSLLEKHLWIPNNGSTRYFKLTEYTRDVPHDTVVAYDPNLHGSNCFKFFRIATGNRHFGALCTDTILGEELIIPYKIQYNDDGELQDYKLGLQIHLNIENHSPFVVLYGTGSAPLVVGIIYFEHLSAYRLFIIYYDSAAESYDIVNVPSTCTGQHDLQPIAQSDVIIRCANGKIVYFNVEYLTFTTLSHSNIEIMSSCMDTASFVLVQGMGDIIFNKSGVTYQLSVNSSGQPLRITSAVCHAINEDDITYYFADATSGAVYELYLGDIVTTGNRQAMDPHVVTKLDDRVITSLYIDGPILWGRVTSSNSSDATAVYLMNLLTMKQSPLVNINGPNVFVQYTAEQCEVTTDTITISSTSSGKKEDSNGQNVAHMIRYILISLGAVVVIVLLAIVSVIVFILYRHHKGSQSKRTRGEELEPSLEMHQIQCEDDDQSQTLPNDSEARLLPEQCNVTRIPDNQQLATPNGDNHLAGHSPIQSIQDENGENGELVSQNVELPNVFTSKTGKSKTREPAPLPLDQPD